MAKEKKKKQKPRGRKRTKGDVKRDKLLADPTVPGDVRLATKISVLMGDLSSARTALDDTRELLLEGKFMEAGAQAQVAISWLGELPVMRAKQIRDILEAWEDVGNSR